MNAQKYTELLKYTLWLFVFNFISKETQLCLQKKCTQCLNDNNQNKNIYYIPINLKTNFQFPYRFNFFLQYK